MCMPLVTPVSPLAPVFSRLPERVALSFTVRYSQVFHVLDISGKAKALSLG